VPRRLIQVTEAAGRHLGPIFRRHEEEIAFFGLLYSLCSVETSVTNYEPVKTSHEGEGLQLHELTNSVYRSDVTKMKEVAEIYVYFG
jgi:hypothetical protein